MRQEEKNQLIDELVEQIQANANMYITDISGLDVETTSKLRRICFNKNVELRVVKNTMLKLALDKIDKDYSSLYEVLKGGSSIMLSDVANEPARIMKAFHKKEKQEKPLLKAAFVMDECYIGLDQLDILENIKSKEELIGEIVSMLQSPAQNVISALQNSGNIIHGVLETIAEKAN